MAYLKENGLIHGIGSFFFIKKHWVEDGSGRCYNTVMRRNSAKLMTGGKNLCLNRFTLHSAAIAEK